MEQELYWVVSEDNGGGLALWVLDDNTVIYMNDGFEYVVGQLTECLTALRDGDDTNTWEGNHSDILDLQEEYDKMLNNEYWPIIAEGHGDHAIFYYGLMGGAGKTEFDPNNEHGDADRFEIFQVRY